MKRPSLIRSLLSWCGAIATIALSGLALATSTYRAEQCSTGAGGGTQGCSQLALPFAEMTARFPLQLAGPVVFLATLSLCSVASAMLSRGDARARVLGGALAGAHAMLALPTAFALPQPFFAAVPFLAAAYAGSIIDLLAAAVVVGGGWIVAAVTLETLYRVIPPIPGFLDLAFPYWSFATALGVGAGAIAGALGRRLPLTRALIGVYLTLGAAALVVQVPLQAFFYPNDAYRAPGGPVLVVPSWLAAMNAVLLPPTFRLWLRAPWAVALESTALTFAGAAIAIAGPLIALAMLRPSG